MRAAGNTFNGRPTFKSSLLTPDEMLIIEYLVRVWNIYVALPTITPYDNRLEFAHGLHRLQDYIAARAVWREEWKQEPEVEPIT